MNEFGRWAIIIGVLLTLGWCSAPGKSSDVDVAIGDSIAVGVGHALGVPTYARVGASSCWIAAHTPRGPFGNVVLSGGINDGGACVRWMRSRIIAHHVTWVMPAPVNGGASAVRHAMRPGDSAVSYSCGGPCTKVHFHPASYPALARKVLSDWRRHRNP